MNSALTQNREKIKTVMMQTFQTEMQNLNPNMQNMLVDDLVTAFYSRLKVMKKISQK
ncbi:MAG: hypothetical protein IAX21_11265 [Candidatus Bathyarchaeota archaeon]|nr:hypothetical protein [Candidatus Bathyarchaeum tardum]WGM88539.1 MAG: hypothetical protein NUK63_06340 [Candidatus Bathyarchaeum tardum]WNZ29190.1 MAG: hypothetical protein IAX21_11265 [Candidatus Bathyarchaeota archaeon]